MNFLEKFSYKNQTPLFTSKQQITFTPKTYLKRVVSKNFPEKFSYKKSVLYFLICLLKIKCIYLHKIKNMDKEKLKEKFLSTYSDYFNNFTNMLSEAGTETEMGDVQKVEKNFVVNPEEIDLLFNAFNELDEWMPSCLGKSLYEEICYYEIHKDFIMPPSLVIGIKQNDLHVVFSLCLVYNPFDYTPVIVATINYPDSRAYSNQFNFMELGKELANGKDGFKNCVRWISRLFIK